MYKKDFPIFQHNKDLVYLDSAASAQKPSYVIDGMKDFMEHSYANIHRGAYSLSEKSEELYYASKDAYAKLIGAEPSEVIYTHNATYGFNILVQALVLSQKLKSGDKILLGLAEHHANIVPRQMASKFGGIEIERIGIDENYDLDIADFQKKYTSNVKVVSLSAASNVTGKVYNLEKIRDLLRPETIFVVDASQALPHFKLDMKSLRCDALVGTGHKMMADTGIGMLAIQKDLLKDLTPAIGGGGSIEDVATDSFTLKSTAEKFEPGTPHIVGAVSLLKAIEYMDSIGGYTAIQKHEHELMEYTLKRFAQLSDNVTLIGTNNTESRIGIFSFVVSSFPNHVQLGELLAQENICVRSGGHCTHPYFHSIEKNGSCRMSLYLYTTKEDVDNFFTALQKIISR